MRMKSTAIAGALAALLMSSTATLAEQTLRVTLQVAANHPLGKNIKFFSDRLDELSGGELKIEMYDSAQLYRGPEVPQAVSSGAIDMGLVSIDEFAGTLPATSIFSVAFLFPSAESIATAAGPESEVRQAIDAEIAKTGARVVWWQDHGPMDLMSKEPVRVPSDMEGKRIRVQGKAAADFAEAVGADPVKISGSEQYLAYQRGTVDMGMTGPTSMVERKLYEVMNYTTATNHAQIEFLVIINNKRWDGLSDEERGWISQAAQEAETKIREETVKDNDDALAYIESNTDMKVIRPTDEELAEWQKAAVPAVQAFVEEAGATGEQLLETARSMQEGQ